MFTKHNSFLLFIVLIYFMLQLNAAATANKNVTETTKEQYANRTAAKNVTTTNNTAAKEEQLKDTQEQQQLHLLKQRAAAVRHIPRRNRQSEEDPTDAYNFDTTHAPCDLDETLTGRVLSLFPSYCIHSYNIRYAHETGYRNWRLYQTEGFFFGQYYVRLNRYESDPHIFDYGGTGLL